MLYRTPMGAGSFAPPSSDPRGGAKLGAKVPQRYGTVLFFRLRRDLTTAKVGLGWNFFSD